MEILLPILIFVGMGIVAGLLLSIFSKIFAVKTDERVDNIISVLPGLNCGVCGFSGCENYAKNIVQNGAETNRCKPGGDGTAKKISDILGIAAEDVIETVASVNCGGKVPNVTSDTYEYKGDKTCAACNLYYLGKGTCDYGCIGYGDCVKVCQYDAISIVDDVAVVDPTKCVGCAMCVAVCPKHIISIREATKTVFVSCASCNNGKTTVAKCKNGCIACKKCEKVCPSDAIHVIDNVAIIDYSKCIACGKCVEECPRKCIRNS